MCLISEEMDKIITILLIAGTVGLLNYYKEISEEDSIKVMQVVVCALAS